MKKLTGLIDKVSSQDSKDEIMSMYLLYMSSRNPLKRVSRCKKYKIALDVIKIRNILEEYDSIRALDKVYNEKYKSKYISDKIKNEEEKNTGILAIKQLINKENKNIEIAFTLKSIEKYNDMYLTFLMIITIIISITVLKFTVLAHYKVDLSSINESFRTFFS